MFLENTDMTCLRQGDILKDILFPRLTSPEVTIIARINPAGSGPVPTVVPMTKIHRDDPQWLTAQLPVRCCYGVVMSQCCDLEPRNQRIVMPTFTVGRLIPIPKSILGDPQRLESLRANKDPRNPADPGFINFFYFPSHEHLGNSEWVVDYNQVISIPSTEYPSVLSQKILQMKDSWRVKFKIKLAVSYARLTDQERVDVLENPWATP